MKLCWLSLVGLLPGLVAPVVGQTNFTTITATGPATNRVNLVIMAEGYLASQFAQFQSDATNVANLLLTNQPYAEYRSYFNVYAIAVASAQAGSDHPNYPQFANTYFNSTYGPSDYYLSIPDNSTGQGKVDALVNTFIPQANLVVLLVNDSVSGGSDAGGRTAVVSRGAVVGTSYAILPHETGHVFANLGDEYSDANPGYPDLEEPNTTRETNRATLKWAAWIDAATPVPTPPTGTYDSTVGLFEGAHYHPSGWYRPKLNCMMKSFGVGFCEICTEAMILAMYQHVRPVDSYVPAQSNQVVATTSPLDLQFVPMVPSGHVLSFEWRTNGVLVTGATGTNLTILPAQLGPGTHQISARAFDATPWVRTDPSNRLSQSVTWQVTVNLPQLQLTALRQVAGKLAFIVTGTAPQGLAIQSSTNLLIWSSMATGALSGGQYQFTNPAPLPRQFFRAITPP